MIKTVIELEKKSPLYFMFYVCNYGKVVEKKLNILASMYCIINGENNVVCEVTVILYILKFLAAGYMKPYGVLLPSLVASTATFMANSHLWPDRTWQPGNE